MPRGAVGDVSQMAEARTDVPGQQIARGRGSGFDRLQKVRQVRTELIDGFGGRGFSRAVDLPAAAVENQRKETVSPSKETLPSYALNCSGGGGAATRWRSAGSSTREPRTEWTSLT